MNEPCISPMCSGELPEIRFRGTTLGSTRAWCPDCRAVEHALYTAEAEGVFMDRICPRGGTRRSPVSLSTDWFMERTRQARSMQQNKTLKPVRRGCPFDCGPCRHHANSLRLPIFSITNNCNLACPICFTHNRPDKVYNKSLDELECILDHIEAQSSNLDMLDLTGGEPTLHPQLFEILDRCTRRSFRRVGVNSNGMVLGRNKAFAEKIKASGVQIILSLDTLEAEKSLRIHGKDLVRSKLDALTMLETLDIPTALLLVWIPGLNDDEIPHLIREYLPKKFICGVTIQNMAYTGYYGSRFSPRRHSTLEEVERGLSERGGFSVDDFFAHGSYHPLCYSTGYFIVDGAHRISFTRLADKALLTAATEERFLMRQTPELEGCFRESIDVLWAAGAPREELALLKKFIARFEKEDARRPGFFHEMVKTVTIHAHMDEDNFDLARVALCGDLVPDESGAMIPACSYNLLYRQKDPRFWVESE
ncbi:MAG: radical SAM protein [Azoarcus sp.]|nr:radical SAM protein [Azoarcus sp.]